MTSQQKPSVTDGVAAGIKEQAQEAAKSVFTRTDSLMHVEVAMVALDVSLNRSRSEAIDKAWAAIPAYNSIFTIRMRQGRLPGNALRSARVASTRPRV